MYRFYLALTLLQKQYMILIKTMGCRQQQQEEQQVR